MRRPPGQVAPPRRYLLALAIIILPWLKLADAQQQQSRPPPVHTQIRSPPEGDQHVASNLAGTPLTALTGQQVVETPRILDRRKKTIAGNSADEYSHSHNDDVLLHDDASAQDLAPDLSRRAAPPSVYRPNRNGVGLSQHIARSLDDWEVEDYVLLATVDGDLYASDRATGHERWHYHAGHPMVETTHFRANKSELDEDFGEIDQFRWVVEPTKDGELYIWRPDENGTPILTRMGWTMKKLVEVLSPRLEQGIMYAGDKKTTMVTLNAATGALIKEFGSSGSYINKIEAESCLKPNAIADGGSGECTDGGTITLGRTEYTVAIHRHDKGQLLASLKYSEWVPNTQDNDLIRQNHVTKDNRYITGQHDGKVYGFDYARHKEERPLFTKSLSSPVARVFDVLHRCETPGGDPHLIALPQPPIPSVDEESKRRRNEKVFLNQTEAGSWYALSGNWYPLIVQAEEARIHSKEWDSLRSLYGPEVDEAFMSKLMVGTHELFGGFEGHTRSNAPNPGRLTLPPGTPIDSDSIPDVPETSPHLPAPTNPTLGGMLGTKGLQDFVLDFVQNPIAFLFTIILLLANRDGVSSVVRKVRKFLNGKLSEKSSPNFQVEVNPTAPSRDAILAEPVADEQPAVANPTQQAVPETATEQDVTPPVVTAEPHPATVAEPQGTPPVVTFDVPEKSDTPPAPDDPSDATAAVEGTPKQKRKAHRGRRGGAKHKKPFNKDKREGSQSRDDEPPQASVEEVINKAKQLGAQPKLEPDILTVNSGVEEISGPILKMGSLEVNEEQQLGTGSNGTVVFAGKWDGRDVAVKRMLVQFNEIASQETRLLRESDDHPNGKLSAWFTRRS
jgi:serine/threonine-protein kinase/endoribonuclease IRE1